MTIEGNARFIPEEVFKPKIQKALDLLKDKGSPDHLWLTTLVEKIRASSRTGAAYADAIIEIGEETFNASLTWLASVLVHECFHLAQCMSGKAYIGERAENEANMIQLYNLRLIGAPQNEITYLLSQDGKHFDLDGDGKYTQEDYRRRKY